MSHHRSITLLRTFVRYVGECAHWSGERGRNSKERQKRSAQLSLDILCFFFAALRDGACMLETTCFSSMVSLMVPLANAS